MPYHRKNSDDIGDEEITYSFIYFDVLRNKKMRTETITICPHFYYTPDSKL